MGMVAFSVVEGKERTSTVPMGKIEVVKRLEKRKYHKSVLKYHKITKKDAIKAAKLESQGISRRQAMRMIGCSPTTADHNQNVLKNNPHYQHAMAEIRQEYTVMGVDAKYIATKVKAGMEATKTISSVNPGKDATERTMDFIEVPDWMAQEKFVRIACKHLGFDVEDNVTSTTINLTAFLKIIQQAEKERGL